MNYGLEIAKAEDILFNQEMMSADFIKSDMDRRKMNDENIRLRNQKAEELKELIRENNLAESEIKGMLRESNRMAALLHGDDFDESKDVTMPDYIEPANVKKKKAFYSENLGWLKSHLESIIVQIWDEALIERSNKCIAQIDKLMAIVKNY